MARTAAGRELTERNRLAQIRLGAAKQADSVELAGLLRLDNLDASRGVWLAAMQSLLQSGMVDSREQAARYIQEFSLAESGQAINIRRPQLPMGAALLDMEIRGPISIKSRIAAGVDPEEARAAAMVLVRQAVVKHVLDAGRDLTNESIRYSGRAGRWRRVTDGSPCAFCAMLAGRGPVYASDTVTFRSHGACGCTSEQVFGEWEPTALEAQWRSSYIRAAMDADDAGLARTAPRPGSNAEDNILWRMRRNSPHLFSDGVWD